MAPERVADMTIEELKAVIAEVVAQQLNVVKRKSLEHPDVAFSLKNLADVCKSHDYNKAESLYQQVLEINKRLLEADQEYPTVATNVTPEETTKKIKTPLPQRTKAEQRARNLAVIELLHEWREEGNEEEERESFGNLKRALDEDRLSDRPLFPHK